MGGESTLFEELLKTAIEPVDTVTAGSSLTLNIIICFQGERTLGPCASSSAQALYCGSVFA